MTSTIKKCNQTGNGEQYYITDCEILTDLTPNRQLCDKVYLCKCNICGSTFTRCRKTLVFHHSDCGCLTHKKLRRGMYTDSIIEKSSKLKKASFLAKLNAIGDPYLSEVFEALYINNRTYGEYTAISMGMSMSAMYRVRRRIHKLWQELEIDNG